jgi:FkbM family methyltransferase
MISSLLVRFYRFWHGKLRQKGAGAVMRVGRSFLPGLRDYRLRLPEGHEIAVDLRDVSGVAWLNHTLGDRFDEEGLLKALSGKLGANAVVWDVGANGGLFSYHVARQAKDVRVIFFEPNPSMFALAEAATSCFSHVEGLPYALSDKSGSVLFTVPQGGSTMGTLEADRTNCSGSTSYIECRTGDELVRLGKVPPPDVIKIDTEGHEIAVLKGLREVIERHRPILFFEHISITDSEMLDLVPKDYSLRTVGDDSGALIEGIDRAKGHNSVLLPDR